MDMPEENDDFAVEDAMFGDFDDETENLDGGFDSEDSSEENDNEKGGDDEEDENEDEENLLEDDVEDVDFDSFDDQDLM